jgi:predicted amidohydrolase
MNTLRYAAAACQIDLPNPARRTEISERVSHMIAMVRMAVEGYSPFVPVKLVVFPEFAHAAPIYPTSEELRRHLTVPVPNEYTERYAMVAKELDVYIQTGTFLEEDPKWPGSVFNTTCLIGPEGLLTKYRKVNPWIPWEVHASPHDLEGYNEELFPVASTPIGGLGVAICYDWLFPEVLRELTAGGAEVLILYGSVGRDGTHGLVDDSEPVPRPGEHRLRCWRQSSGQPLELPTVLVAGGKHDCGF